jgi:hypothetical protein
MPLRNRKPKPNPHPSPVAAAGQRAEWPRRPGETPPTSPPYLPYISPTSPLHLPYISPTPPVRCFVNTCHLPSTSPTSPLHLPCTSPASERSGHAAQVAYHAQGYQPPAVGPLPAKARVAMAQKGQVPGYLTLDLAPSLPLSLALSLALPYNPNPNPSPNPITLTLALALAL